MSRTRSGPATVAFYLPQFHPVPDNDAWYGRGFTDWHSVVRARPLFTGHEQPNLPGELGFYDLRLPEVLDAQAALARRHGIDAFCVYHYWFEGHRPLRRVVDRFLGDDGPDIPFCLAWANENWSRHWDASEHEVLLRQRYDDDDLRRHGEFLLAAMSHPRYLRVQGRPVLFIYRIQSLPEPARVLNRWREQWAAGGLPDVEIVKFETRGDASDPGLSGADAAAQFVPHGTAERVAPLHGPGAQPGNLVLDYSAVAEHYLHRETPPAWRRYECVVPRWDNSPRRGDGQSFVLHGASPVAYGEWLRGVHRRTAADGLVLINAWNEWGEGAYLEPDVRHHDAFLRATADALGVEPGTPGPTTTLSAESPPVRDRFAELYLDGLEAETRLRRRLSRLEATFERELETALHPVHAENLELREQTTRLARENERLRRALEGSRAQ